MLFTNRFWEGIADGSITVAFRRWRKRAAKPGGRQRFRGDVLAIDDVLIVDETQITDADSLTAGYDSREELLAELARISEGALYRIDFHVAGADPRTALREQRALTADDIDAVQRRLVRMDASSPVGAWTLTTLLLIRDRPAVRAADLAASIGRDTPRFKIDVRKLKELGLTESLEVGYRLSPRGRVVLGRLERA